MNRQRITAHTTATSLGRRTYRRCFFVIDPDRTELNFAPATETCPAQARVFVYVWNAKLRRHDLHPELVVRDTITRLDPEPEPVAPDVDDQDNTETDPAFATVSITISGAPFLVAGTLDRLSLP